MLDQNQQLALLASVNEINLKLKCITLAVENPHLGTDSIKKAGEFYAFITTPTGLKSEITDALIGEAVTDSKSATSAAPESSSNIGSGNDTPDLSLEAAGATPNTSNDTTAESPTSETPAQN